METAGVFSKELPMALHENNGTRECVEALLEMLDKSHNRGTAYHVHDDTLYNQAMLNTTFVEWLYDRGDMELFNDKKELMIRIGRAMSINSMDELTAIINDSNSFLIGNQDSYKFVWCVDDFFTFKQYQLKQIASRDLFAQELQNCYKNLFFDEKIQNTINTLETNFRDIRNLLIEHLHKLDKHYDDLCKIRSGEGYNSELISDEFTRLSGIECAPQTDRDKLDALRREYVNSTTQKKETLVCELHTKFPKINQHWISDRIYFHLGKAGIHDGKIIIAHIGRHE